jgi:hypothetical protein
MGLIDRYGVRKQGSCEHTIPQSRNRRIKIQWQVTKHDITQKEGI